MSQGPIVLLFGCHSQARMMTVDNPVFEVLYGSHRPQFFSFTEESLGMSLAEVIGLESYSQTFEAALDALAQKQGAREEWKSHVKMVVIGHGFSSSMMVKLLADIGVGNNASTVLKETTEKPYLVRLSQDVSTVAPPLPTQPLNALNAGRFPIEELELGVRAYNRLKREGIRSVGDLIRMTDGELMQIPNFGRTSLDEIVEVLAQRGLTLRTAVHNKPIEELDLSMRAYNVLKNHRIETVGNLCSKTRNELLLLRGLGKESLENIEAALAELGLELRASDS